MDYPVRLEGCEVGTVSLEEQGARTQIRVSCRRSDRGLYRAYLLCAGGEYPLGVLEPREDRLCLRRTALTEQLHRLGEIRGAEMRMSCAFAPAPAWQPLPQPEQFFCRSPELAAAAAGLAGALQRREGESLLLALPYDSGAPFPLTALFCLAEIRQIGGRPYAVYAFDREERPQMPKKGRKRAAETEIMSTNF